MSTPIPSGPKSEESLYHDHSSGTSSWESGISVGAIFEEFLVNMIQLAI